MGVIISVWWAVVGFHVMSGHFKSGGDEAKEKKIQNGLFLYSAMGVVVIMVGGDDFDFNAIGLESSFFGGRVGLGCLGFGRWIWGK